MIQQFINAFQCSSSGHTVFLFLFPNRGVYEPQNQRCSLATFVTSSLIVLSFNVALIILVITTFNCQLYATWSHLGRELL